MFISSISILVTFSRVLRLLMRDCWDCWNSCIEPFRTKGSCDELFPVEFFLDTEWWWLFARSLWADTALLLRFSFTLLDLCAFLPPPSAALSSRATFLACITYKKYRGISSFKVQSTIVKLTILGLRMSMYLMLCYVEESNNSRSQQILEELTVLRFPNIML